MDKEPLNRDVLAASIGTEPATRRREQKRTRKLPLIANPLPPRMAQVDPEPSTQELMGAPEVDRRETLLDSIPESKRWDPVPGSTGHQAPETPSEDEDVEGQSEGAQLVERGAANAGRDQALQALRAAKKENGREP